MAWDWTSQTLDPVALVRVSYREGGEVRYARWSGPQGRAGSGVNWYDPDGLTADVQHWEARLLGGMQIEESLGAIDKPELSIGSLSLRVRCPASSEDGSSNALRRSILEDRWERGDVVVWLLDRDSLETREVYRGRAPWGPSPIDDEQFTLQTEALPFDLPDLRVPHTRFPSSVDGYTTTSTPSFPVFDPPANYVMHEQYRGKVVGPVVGDPTGNSSYGWMQIVPFGVRNLSGNILAVYCHMSPLFGVFARDAAYEGSGGDTVLVSDIMASGSYSGPDLVRSYENTDPTQGPVGSNVIVKIDTTSSGASIQWLNEGRRFYARCYGYGTGELDPADLPHYQYSVIGSGETVPPSTANTVQRYDALIEDVLEGAEWAGLPGVYGVGSVAALYSSAPTSSSSFDNASFVLVPEPTDDAPYLRDVLAGASISLGLDLCPRVDLSDGAIRLFPLWRQPQSASQTPDWTLDESDLQKQSPPRGIKLAQDPDRVYGNVISVQSPERFMPPLPDTADDPRPKAQDEFTNRIADEINAVGTEVDRAPVKVKAWQFKPDVAGGTPTGFSTSRFRIAKDIARRQPVVTAAGGFPLARVQLGDVVVWDIEGYPDTPGQVRSRSIDLATGKVTLRSHHALAWDIFGEGD